MTGKVLTVGCMDRRLWTTFDQSDQGTKFLRSGGANVQDLRISIEGELNTGAYGRIKIVTHSDCGYCNAVYNLLSGLNVRNKGLYELAKPFEKDRENVHDPKDIERASAKIWGGVITEFSRGMNVEFEHVDVSRIDVPSKKAGSKYALAISQPFSGKYEDLAKELGTDPWMTYFLHATTISQLKPHINLATSQEIGLGIEDVRIVAFGKREVHAAREAQFWLRKKLPHLKAKGVEPKVVVLGERPNAMTAGMGV